MLCKRLNYIILWFSCLSLVKDIRLLAFLSYVDGCNSDQQTEEFLILFHQKEWKSPSEYLFLKCCKINAFVSISKLQS